MIKSVFVEKEAENYPLTYKILENFPYAQIFWIEDANALYNRTNQNYSLQKQNQSLILAVNHGNFIYKGSDNCQNFGAQNFYYASLCKNCIYNCDYCYLQGMYRSGNILAYVNVEDCFAEVDKLLENTTGDILLPIAYDSDIYALEEVFGYVGLWSDYLLKKNCDRLTVELRTKCGTMQFLDKIKAKNNFVVTWSLNPDNIIKKYECRTSPLCDRLNAIRCALDMGLRVRVAIDPIIAIENSLDDYIALADRIVPFVKRLDGVAVGMFRIPTDFLKIMRKNAKLSPLSWDDYEIFGHSKTYSKEISELYLEKICETLGQGQTP